MAPITPMIVVMMSPPGSSPGRSAFAIAPAMSPRMMNAMIPIPSLLQIPSARVVRIFLSRVSPLRGRVKLRAELGRVGGCLDR